LSRGVLSQQVPDEAHAVVDTLFSGKRMLSFQIPCYCGKAADICAARRRYGLQAAVKVVDDPEDPFLQRHLFLRWALRK